MECVELEPCLLRVEYADAGFLLPNDEYRGLAAARAIEVSNADGTRAHGFLAEVGVFHLFLRSNGPLSERRFAKVMIGRIDESLWRRIAVDERSTFAWSDHGKGVLAFAGSPYW